MDNYENINDEMMEEKEISGESKAEKFIRLVPPRVDKVIKALDTLGNCSGSGYEYTEDQVEKIFATISDKLEETKGKFNKKGTKTEKFSF